MLGVAGVTRVGGVQACGRVTFIATVFAGLARSLALVDAGILIGLDDSNHW